MKKPGRKTYHYKSFLTPPELKAALERASVEQDRSEAWIIKKALLEYLKKIGVRVSPSGN